MKHLNELLSFNIIIASILMISAIAMTFIKDEKITKHDQH